MKNYKLLYASFDLETGISTVTIGTDLGEFTGETTCKDSDRENMSQIFGCEVAELKAWRKYAKARAAVEGYKLKALKDFCAKMEKTRTFDSNAYWYKQLLVEMRDTKEKRNHWRMTVERISQGIQRTIVARELGLKRLKRK